MEGKTSTLTIRCRESTRRRVRAFKEANGFKNLEEMLIALIDYWEGRGARTV